MIYTKEEINNLTLDMIKLCEEELAKGNKSIEFSLRLQGPDSKPTKVYLDCEKYVSINKFYYGK